MPAPGQTRFIAVPADDQPIAVTRRMDGSVRAALDERFADFAVVTLGADGKPRWTCVTAAGRRTRLMRRPRRPCRPGSGHGVGGEVKMTRLRTVLAATALLASVATSAFASATIVIINLDGPGEGFNDATPAAPVGGNAGTTVGQQRLLCFQQAASIWGSILTSSVTIQIQAAFNPLSCTATSAVLGSAGPRFVEFGAAGLEFNNYWYHEALACKEAGTDLTPLGTPACRLGTTAATSTPSSTRTWASPAA
jgi:hypothetical protein